MIIFVTSFCHVTHYGTAWGTIKSVDLFSQKMPKEI